MNKKIRQYIGLLFALLMYYIIHEGTHLIYALSINAFKQIHFIGLGVQIDIYAEKITKPQLAIFCIVGSIATTIVAYLLVVFINKICKVSSKVFKACMYYMTLAFLFIDPIYLSLLCVYFGGGDMNGISLLIPEFIARSIYGIMFIINLVVFIKIVVPKYKLSFLEK